MGDIYNSHSTNIVVDLKKKKKVQDVQLCPTHSSLLILPKKPFEDSQALDWLLFATFDQVN